MHDEMSICRSPLQVPRPTHIALPQTYLVLLSTMERVEKDATPAEKWQASLNATCNRLSTQYLNLLRAASSVTALEETTGRQDPRCAL